MNYIEGHGLADDGNKRIKQAHRDMYVLALIRNQVLIEISAEMSPASYSNSLESLLVECIIAQSVSHSEYEGLHLHTYVSHPSYTINDLVKP